MLSEPQDPSHRGSVVSADLAGLRRFSQLTGAKFRCGILLYDGKTTLSLGDNLWTLPFQTLWT